MRVAAPDGRPGRSSVLTMAPACGAGDGNRTRMFSLGTVQGTLAITLPGSSARG